MANSLIYHNDQLLFVNNQLAFNTACCCGVGPEFPLCCYGYTIPELLRATITGQTGDTCAGALGDYVYLQFDWDFRFWTCPYPFNSTGRNCGPGCISRIILDCDPGPHPSTRCDPGPQWLLTLTGLANFTDAFGNAQPINVECDFTCDPLNLVFNVIWDSPAAPTFGCCMDHAHHSGTLQFTVNAA